ncbi:MAG: D-tyrosyl-tRNA(Tyr) deacylase [Rikenellaceae bacterium]|nr:D-tyrosyl-tRNA(Tyr) deacylase [Rikenellaceae bacterium]
MRIVIQRVTQSEVTIAGRSVGKIGKGLMILLGVEAEDTDADIEWLCGKVARLRIFDDENGVMNLDIGQVGGEALVVSQFTLYASTKKGNRPSYIRSAPEPVSRPMYERFLERLSATLGKEVAHGEFGADMQVSLVNDGPVTICIDSRNRE